MKMYLNEGAYIKFDIPAKIGYWTGVSKIEPTSASHLPLVAKPAFLQTATAASISGPIYETFFCSGSLKPGRFGYLWQTALALIGPI